MKKNDFEDFPFDEEDFFNNLENEVNAEEQNSEFDDNPFPMDFPLFNDVETFDEKAEIREFVEKIPLLSPAEIVEQLEKYGYKGQIKQKQALALMAYRHIRRLKRLHLEEVERETLPPKQNVLLVGPTGCGKTYLVELLFQKILQLPTVIVDITSFTEAGYVGDDIRTIITRLISKAEGKIYLAECGIVCLDEFDKLAASTSNARFSGAGTTKDVSGYGVQRELLTMLHGAEISVPLDYGFSEFGSRSNFSTRDVPFIACGAFSGLSELLKEQTKIGFQNEKNPLKDLSMEDVEKFQKYGFMPELIGRFSRIVEFPPLPADALRQILIENILPQYENEFIGEKLTLKVTENALDFIVKRSEKRKTGARSLQIELITAIEQAAFETKKKM
ncbi:MAG: AAA family ATPase [Pyrinomonadaceae bacterium]|nr:AAA family ATPase [Pyrinomonadaceae bacterium]